MILSLLYFIRTFFKSSQYNKVYSILMIYFIGLSILQNGKLPQFLSDKIIHDIFMAEEKSQCVKYLIQGFEKFGIALFQVDFNAFNI